MAHWFPDVMHDVAAYKFVFGPSVGIYFISLIYCRVADMLRAERRQKEQQAEQLSSELKFLRSQVSPHFLFNVLTNLVSLARKKSDQLEPALIRLSDLMRYTLCGSLPVYILRVQKRNGLPLAPVSSGGRAHWHGYTLSGNAQRRMA